MAAAFEVQIRLCNIDGFFKIIIREAGHDRAHLLFTYHIFLADSMSLHDQYPGSFRNGDTCFSTDHFNTLPYDVATKSAVIEDGIHDFLTVFFGYEICTVLYERFKNFLFIFRMIKLCSPEQMMPLSKARPVIILSAASS